MVLFNYSTKELTAKIVYYGPGLCGKTTNLQFIFENLPTGIHKGKMLSLATKTDRTLFFDFLPIDLGTIRSMRTRLQLYTVPGQVFYNTTRKLVLKGADGVVFVADSQRKMIEANVESFSNLEENLAEHGMKLAEMPHIIQFNKRDLPNVAPAEELNAALNKYNAPIYEAVATTGIGVHDTLKAVTRLVLNALKERYGESKKLDREPAPKPAGAPPPPARPAARVKEAPVATASEAPVLEVEAAMDEEPVLAVEPEEPAIAVEPEGPVLSVAEEEPAIAVEPEEPVPAEFPAEIEEESPLTLEETVAEAPPARRHLAAEVPSRGTMGAGDDVLEVLPEPSVEMEEEPAMRPPPDEPVTPLQVSSPEPFEFETASVDPPASLTPSGPARIPAGGAAAASGVSAETRAVALAARGGTPVPEGGREASFPIAVDMHGQTLRLMVTITVRVEKA